MLQFFQVFFVEFVEAFLWVEYLVDASVHLLFKEFYCFLFSFKLVLFFLRCFERL